MQQQITFPETFSPEFVSLVRSFTRDLQARNRSELTITTYLVSLRIFSEYIISHNMPQAIESITREHIEEFIHDLLQTHKPAAVSTRYRSLRVFFNWLVEEGELPVSPMRRMKEPFMPEDPPEVLTEEQLKAILATCTGKDFFSRRATAVIRILIDTGMRRSEIANLKLEDIDWDLGVLKVQKAKGGRMKICPIGKKAILALDRYIRVRSKHPHANEPWLWLGHKGRLTDDGIYKIVVKQCTEAGIPDAFTHLFRHQFAHMWLESGGQEGDLMRLGGWRSTQMMRKYAAGAADQRAREKFRELSPGDRI